MGGLFCELLWLSNAVLLETYKLLEIESKERVSDKKIVEKWIWTNKITALIYLQERERQLGHIPMVI